MWAARLRQDGGAALARLTAADKKQERLRKCKRPRKAAGAPTRGEKVHDALTTPLEQLSETACVPSSGAGIASKKARASTSLEELAEVSAALGNLACPEVSGDGGVEADALPSSACEEVWRGGPRPKWKAAPMKSKSNQQLKVLRSDAPIIKAIGRGIRELP